LPILPHMLKTLPATGPQILDPTKQADEFRNYETSAAAGKVAETYRLMHENQTLEFGKAIRDKYLKDTGKRHTIWQLIEQLDQIVDESDPDLDLPQIIHLLQTAEALRAKYPELDWLHLVGLLHDVGKIIALPEYGQLPQWCVVGDTFIIGCKPEDVIVHNKFFAKNPDTANPALNSKFGMYEPNCGLDHLMFSWGHDEYMYQVLKRNECKIPKEGLDIIRFHSFYPWHTHGGYRHLTNESDEEKLMWVKRFNECDLYSKSNVVLPDPVALRPYYQGLIDKYFPDPILKI